MAEEKKKDVELLEKRIEELEAELKKVTEVANSYIQAHRDLLGQVRSTFSTALTLEGMLAEKLK